MEPENEKDEIRHLPGCIVGEPNVEELTYNVSFQQLHAQAFKFCLVEHYQLKAPCWTREPSAFINRDKYQ